jgi:uncharacterized protein with PIN domain
MAKNIAFTVESTLGRLCKWLRMLGFDTILEGRGPEADGAGQTPVKRLFLTRTQHLSRQNRSDNILFIADNEPLRQMQTVIRSVGITRADIRLFSRCLQCNAPIESIDREAVKFQVPDYIWQQQAEFKKCPACSKIYWQGSHRRRVDDMIQRWFGS